MSNHFLLVLTVLQSSQHLAVAEVEWSDTDQDQVRGCWGRVSVCPGRSLLVAGCSLAEVRVRLPGEAGGLAREDLETGA